MIAKLSGALDSTGDGWAVVDVGGVGYQVFCSARTLARLPALGHGVSLAVETHVREDHIHLYGFEDAAERAWFRLLLTVQGVGARVALAILSVLGPAELARAIAAQDRAQLSRAEGVGAKLAGRIASELKEKPDVPGLAPAAGGAGAVTDGGPAEDAVSALVNLGYGRSEAFGAVSQGLRALGGEATLEALVRAGLKELAA